MKKTLIFMSVLHVVACKQIEQLKETIHPETTASNSEQSTPPEPKTVAWLVLTDASSKGETRLLSGQVSAAETTNLAFESSGKVQSVAVKLGEHFRQGSTLARLDKTNYQLQLRQAKAAYGTAVANRDQARKEVKRFERLVNAKAASAIQLDNYRLQYKTAQEAINNAQAQIELAEKQLKDTTLIAPFSGVVTAQLGEVGQLASPQVPILTVEADAETEVSLSVPENMIAQVKPQQTVMVNLPSQKNIGRIAATVSEIATQATYGAFPVKLILMDAPATVKPGMTAEVALPLPHTTSGFRIPPSALGAGKNNSHFVYRIISDVDKPDALKLESVPVTVKTLSDNRISIHGQLHTGDKIVRSGWSFLTPEQSVSLMGEGAQTVNP